MSESHVSALHYHTITALRYSDRRVTRCETELLPLVQCKDITCMAGYPTEMASSRANIKGVAILSSLASGYPNQE